MTQTNTPKRRFLFLQGPHGPFFGTLAQALRATGADCLRVAFNQGDAFFWPDKAQLIRFEKPHHAWPEYLSHLLEHHRITDLVLYGDTRPIHAQAIKLAKTRGLRIHVFEEGYLRPYWITYERDGSNGNSALMGKTMTEIKTALAGSGGDLREAPSHWGDTRQHIFYGAVYHFFVMFLNRRFRNFRPHRTMSVSREFWVYMRRLLATPMMIIGRNWRSQQVLRRSAPYHLVLMQLEHDAAFAAHSPFENMQQFLTLVVESFAKGAPAHHHLVFKAHPLEDGRLPLNRIIQKLAARHGLAGRVHYIPGGKLARLLDQARSAVTVNSTAAQQALWRNLPVRIFGAAVYGKPALVSSQSLSAFFAAPTPPQRDTYRQFRQYLLETSQVPGGYYSHKGRRKVMRLVVDMMLAQPDPYTAINAPDRANAQQLRLVETL
jgi:capsular polysaccharide export protein